MKLSEIYTMQEFKELVKDTYSSATALGFVDEEAQTMYADMISYIVYNFYNDNEIAYTTKEKFAKYLTIDLIYVSQKDYSYFKLQFDLFNNNKINNKGSLVTNRDVKQNQTSGSFTKQAQTPSVVQPSTEFIDDYTNYQSNTDRKLETNDNYKTTIERTYGNVEIIDLYKRLPRSFLNDIINAVKHNFIIIMEGDY